MQSSLLTRTQCLLGTLWLAAAGAWAQAAGTSSAAMERVAVDQNVELEYLVRGTGEPVVLVHAGLFADWFAPLLDQPLTSRYRVISFHRVGYAGSSKVSGAVSIARQAEHVRALMRHLRIERAHLVGHSSGGNIALQLALDAPQHVQSLALLEPALPVGTGDARMLSTRQAAIRTVREHFSAGNKAGAVDAFMRMVAGPTYRVSLDRVLRGAFDRGVIDADTFFTQELPALQQWQFTRADAQRVRQPVLAVIGEKSPEVSSIWTERQQLMLQWLPNAQGFVLSGATHLLHVENPRGMAEALVAFFARHAIAPGR